MTTTDDRPVDTTTRECPDHWHCDPQYAAHNCAAPDRDRPCATCGADPKWRGRAFIARRVDDAAESVPAVTHEGCITALNAVLRVHRPGKVVVAPDDVEWMCSECYETVDAADPMCRSLRAIATAWHDRDDFDPAWWL